MLALIARTEWAAMTAISGRLGMSAESLRTWVRHAEVDAREEAGVPPESARELQAHLLAAPPISVAVRRTRPLSVIGSRM